MCDLLVAAKEMETKAMIAQMSDSDLAQQLKSLNEDIGPITRNTRPLYERRLMKHLILEQASSCTITYTPLKMDDPYMSQTLGNEKHKTVNSENLCHTNDSVDSPQGVSDDGDVHGGEADSAVFFGVQLQADALHSCGKNTLNYLTTIVFIS